MLDTGPFVRFGVSSDPLHARVVARVRELTDEGWELVYSPQAVREGWNVLTRPKASGGYAYSVAEATEIMRVVRQSFTLLPDVPEIFERWEALVGTYGITGKSVHDANVVATALAHGATHILTLNERDFRRYVEVAVIVP